MRHNCQSFSIAGRRGGLDDARGNLAIEFCQLAGRLRPRWIVWENVPGVLSSNGGRDFGSIVGMLAELGYGCAWRVLDAQFLGVPQRRRRVFVVGHLGDWRRAAAVLLEREGMHRDTATRRKAQAKVASLTASGVGTCGADDNQGQAGHLIPVAAGTMLPSASAAGGQMPMETDTDRAAHLIPLAYGGGNTSGSIRVSTALTRHGVRLDFDTETLVAHTLHGQGHDASEDGTGRGAPLVPVAFSAKDWGADIGGTSPTLRAMQHHRGHANSGGQVAVCDWFAVRRLTPRECERLQGMPDDYTLIPYRGKPAKDGPRYRAIGNSMAVPVMRWIGRRIQIVDGIRG